MDEAKKAGAATINYGLFLNVTIDFVIVAFALFLLIRQINRLKREQSAAAPTVKECSYCLSSIPVKAVSCPRNCRESDHTGTYDLQKGGQ